ncbi:Fic protein [Knoellia subterranea KCTC 19937]|uniref:Fic protein n=2 Tax=Knoellia TaxID=136099 RepID=A0A0A0JLD5_9MICO|nr:Fic protein [Knoellia subterranea KCTC 19937]
MAHWEDVVVRPDFRGVSRRERQGGRYRRYHPDLLTAASTSNSLTPALTEYAADVTTGLARLGESLRATPFPILYATSVRSEAISSSWIEGVRETPRAVAVAQIGYAVASHVAGQIVRNVSAMQDAIELLGKGDWKHEHLWAIHHDLLPDEPFGYRDGQVWVGGSSPLTSQYAGPPHEVVPELMDDLLTYANTSGDLPVIQAAVIHAQFETVHPFSDGNGRTGRALVHGVLARSGLVEGGVIPLSTALRRDVDGYIRALTAYRYDGDARADGVESFVGAFLAYVEEATVTAQTFVAAARRLHERWQQSISGVRSDAALRRAVDLVVENPVVSAPFVAERLNVSTVTANHIVKQLVEAHILKPATGQYRRAALFQADDVLSLLQFGAEAGPTSRAPALAGSADAERTLIHRCGVTTVRGSCGNRVAHADDLCWRHRT